jgi:2-hydroxychromene-2-carboxylate isomerase
MNEPIKNIKQIQWYFDFISPYAYFACEQLENLPSNTTLIYKPVLFAGLLKHWECKGPAEVKAQRLFTYRYCHWKAQQLEIPYKTPTAHPFNPLPALRLSLSLNNHPDVVSRIFRHIWWEGGLPDAGEAWAQFAEELYTDYAAVAGVKSLDESKNELRENTQEAISKGVFGVPTFVVDDEIFFGQDSMAFLNDYFIDPNIFKTTEMQRLNQLPIAASR